MMTLQYMRELLEKVIGEDMEITEQHLLKSDQITLGQSSLMLSSLELVDLIVAVEEAFSICITQDEAIRFVTVKDMIDFVNAEITRQNERNIEVNRAKVALFGDQNEVVKI